MKITRIKNYTSALIKFQNFWGNSLKIAKFKKKLEIFEKMTLK